MPRPPTRAGERATFLRAVRDNPDDDLPRLVYADWLEEHGGDPEWAEFIRIQCGWLVAPEGREREVHAASWRRWCITADGWQFSGVRGDHWRRGFLEVLACTWAECREHLDAVLDVMPINEVWLWTQPVAVVRLAPGGPVLYLGRAGEPSLEVPGFDWQPDSPTPKASDLLAFRWPGVTFHPPCG
jgi:uncharacterized protein (TIGR02996 family)